MPGVLSINALLADIQTRIRTNGLQQITGAIDQDVLLNIVFSILNVINNIPINILSQYPDWDGAHLYPGGVNTIVRYGDFLYLFISGTDDTGTTPGTNSAVWQQLNVLALAHFQNQDQYLDFGGPYQVSAQELFGLLSLSAPDLATVLAAGNGSGAFDILMADGQSVKFGNTAKVVQLLATTLTADRVITLPNQDGMLALTTDRRKQDRWLNPVNAFIAAPTGSEANGTRYIITTGTGVFTGFDTAEAELVAGTWVILPTRDGDSVKVLGVTARIYMNEGGTWVARTLGNPAPTWERPVQGVEVNAPFGGEPNGTRYILDASPTGAFSGHAFNIAELVAGTWVFTAQQTGMVAVGQGYAVYNIFFSGAWHHYDLEEIVTVAGVLATLGTTAFTALETDGTFPDNDDAHVPSVAAAKTYIDAAVGTSGLNGWVLGDVDPVLGILPIIKGGNTYNITVEDP